MNVRDQKKIRAGAESSGPGTMYFGERMLRKVEMPGEKGTIRLEPSMPITLLSVLLMRKMKCGQLFLLRWF